MFSFFEGTSLKRKNEIDFKPFRKHYGKAIENNSEKILWLLV